jgi:UDP-N-acetylglucosamine 2-epimerase
MPEEINRVLTDAISDLLFCTEQAAWTTCCARAWTRADIPLVGNVMIDTLLEPAALRRVDRSWSGWARAGARLPC